MVEFPRRGACLCGALVYSLGEEPLTLYACHCTDCQRQSGSSFALSMIVRREALEVVVGRPEQYSVEQPDGRLKQAHFCSRCSTRLWGPSNATGLLVLGPGTLDDTSWLNPVGHIWTRSAQPWVVIPESARPALHGTHGERGLASNRRSCARDATRRARHPSLRTVCCFSARTDKTLQRTDFHAHGHRCSLKNRPTRPDRSRIPPWRSPSSRCRAHCATTPTPSTDSFASTIPFTGRPKRRRFASRATTTSFR